MENGEPSPGDISVPDVVNFESNALDLPAPEIDLGGGAPGADADKPLGPRRLALLREQMEQHVKEVAENQSDDPEYVDQELAQQQVRMATLASRAALSSDEDRMAAERAMAEASEASDDAQPMTSSIPSDQVRRRDLRGDPPADVDEAEREPEPVPDVEPEPVPDVEPESVADVEPEPVTDPEPLKHAEPESVADAESEPPTDAEPDFTGESESAVPSGAAASSTESEPAQPVSALDAQGLELMEPGDYRQSSHLKTIMLVLAAVVLLAVAVIVLLILL